MENARYWIGVVAADRIERAVAEGACAFSHRLEAPTRDFALIAQAMAVNPDG